MRTAKIVSCGLISALSSLMVKNEVMAEVGESVCITGYVVDNFCIDNGKFLDNDFTPLGNPEEHTFHCAFDVPQCIESGYTVLIDKAEGEEMYSLGYRLSDTDAVLAKARASGQKGGCTSCTGDETMPTKGFRATVKGTVADLGDGSVGAPGGVPLLSGVMLKGHDVSCEDFDAVGGGDSEGDSEGDGGDDGSDEDPSSGVTRFIGNFAGVAQGIFMVLALGAVCW